MSDGDGTDRADYEHPWQLGWSVRLSPDGTIRAVVVGWSKETLAAEGATTENTEPEFTIEAAAAASLAEEMRTAADRAKVMTGLIPIARDAGADGQQFVQGLIQAIDHRTTLDALGALAGVFGGHR